MIRVEDFELVRAEADWKDYSETRNDLGFIVGEHQGRFSYLGTYGKHYN